MCHSTGEYVLIHSVRYYLRRGRRRRTCERRLFTPPPAGRSSTSTRWWRTSVSTASATSSWSRSSAACAASRRASAASRPGGKNGKEGSAVSQEAERCENRRVPPLLGGRLPELCPLRRDDARGRRRGVSGGSSHPRLPVRTGGDAHGRLEGCRRRGGGGQGGHVRRHDRRAPRVPQAVGLRQGVCQHPGRGSWRQEEGCLSQHVEGRRPPCAVRSRRVCISFMSLYLLRLGCRVRGLRELLVTARILITMTRVERRSGRPSTWSAESWYRHRTPRAG